MATFCYICSMTFEQYFKSINESAECYGMGMERQVYEFCARKWVERGNDPASIPSIEDLAH